MDQAELSRTSKIQMAATAEFEACLRHALDEPWWRRFIDLVKDQRQGFLEALATQLMEQRQEDITRGQIATLTWIIALDATGDRQLRRNGNA